MNDLEFKTSAIESYNDPRTVIHDVMVSPYVYTKGGSKYTFHEHQHKVGICTAISNVQYAEKVTGKKYSPDFQYLLQKKYIDQNWIEGSSLLSALKAAKRYGYLPLDKFTYITENDRYLSYDEYITKLRSITDIEIQQLLTMCEKPLTGYAQVDISSKESIASAIDSSKDKSGIICMYYVGKEWWTAPDGIVTWDPARINPIPAPAVVTGGHAIIMSQYDYTQNSSQTLSNTWGNTWCLYGDANVNFDNYKMREAWIPYFDSSITNQTNQTKIKFTSYLTLGSQGAEVKQLQEYLQSESLFPSGMICTGFYGKVTKLAVNNFQIKYGIQMTGTVGPVTRAKLNSLNSLNSLNLTNQTMTPQTKTELISVAHTFIAVLGAAVISNINTLDLTHLNKDVLIAFGVAILRSLTKTMWNTYFPTQS